MSNNRIQSSLCLHGPNAMIYGDAIAPLLGIFKSPILIRSRFAGFSQGYTCAQAVLPLTDSRCLKLYYRSIEITAWLV